MFKMSLQSIQVNKKMIVIKMVYFLITHTSYYKFAKVIQMLFMFKVLCYKHDSVTQFAIIKTVCNFIKK